MADPTLRLECRCPNCTYPIYIVAKVYEMHNRDGTLHTCGDAMADSEHLTYRDCSEYVLCRIGDETFSRCKITNRYCMADEEGLECSIWEEEKAEILREEDVPPDIFS